jgi:opacity protein-like surface antigen
MFGNFAADLGATGGVIIMKRSLVLAVSVLALTAVSKPLFAAEAETPAPSERAAPAAERTERARPARQRQATRNGGQQQASSQPSESSWTGSQVGGYGGGNAGGGSFADGPCLQPLGFNPPPSSPISQSSPPSSQSSSSSTCATGPGINKNPGPKFFPLSSAGASFETPKIPIARIPMMGTVLVGAVIDIFTGTPATTFTQNNSYVPALGSMTNETITGTFREGANGSLRAKVGVPIYNNWVLVYFTAGAALAKTEASYTYTATNFGPMSAPGSSLATNAYGTQTFSQTRTGFSGGGGLEVMTGIPGVKLAFDYTYTNFGSFSQNVPLLVTTCPAGPAACTNGSAVVNINHISFQRAVVGVKFGL